MTSQNHRAVWSQTTGHILLRPQDMLGSGGEGSVYRLRNHPELVAKVYHRNKLTSDTISKLEVMIDYPPRTEDEQTGHLFVSWPKDTIHDTQQGPVVGFIMPVVDKTNGLYGYYIPFLRRKNAPDVNYANLCSVAKSLAVALDRLHGINYTYLVGDINESNAYITENEHVTLIDADSFQVTDSRTIPPTIYRCRVGKPEYTPPELQGKSFAQIDRNINHENFALAVVIYQLLMEGTHPFRGIYTGPGEKPQVEACISRGYFLHSRRANLLIPLEPVPTSVPWESLHPRLRDLFHRCFDEGHSNPQRRPQPREWADALDEAVLALRQCAQNPSHRYFSNPTSNLGNPACTWCVRKARTRIDSFPYRPESRHDSSPEDRSQAKRNGTPPGNPPAPKRTPNEGRRKSATPIPKSRGRGIQKKLVGIAAACIVGGGIIGGAMTGGIGGFALDGPWPWTQATPQPLVPVVALIPTNTPTPTPTSTHTPIPTSTPTSTRTPSPTNTPLPTSTHTAIPTSTPTSTQTLTPFPTSTGTPTVTPPPTETPVPTATPFVCGHVELTLMGAGKKHDTCYTPTPTQTPTAPPAATHTPLPTPTETLVPCTQFQPGSDLNRCDLSGKDLRGFDLTGADLRYANLEEAELEDAVLIEANLSDANLQKSNLKGAILANATIAGASIEGIDLTNVNLSSTDMSEIQSFNGAVLNRVIFPTGIDLESADFTRAELYLADLTGANLKGANFRGANIDGAILSGADLRGANLAAAEFREIDFESMPDFRGADLRNADFSKAILNGANFSEARLEEAKFHRAEMMGAIFDNAELEDAVMTSAELQGASFKNADAVSVDFSDSELESANFDGADIDRAKYAEAVLTGANFRGAQNADAAIFDDTVCSDGVESNSCYYDGRLHGIRPERGG